MVEALNLFGVDILSTIASHLDQDDVISWSLSSKKFKGVYPKDIVHKFPEDASEEDYLNFIDYVAKRNIETLKVYVNPHQWNQVAHRLGRQWFKKVTIVPNHPMMYNYVYDKITSWIPECDELILGFVSTSDRVHVSWKGDKLRLWTDQTSFPTIPYIDPEIDAGYVICCGRFVGYDRLWNLSKICISMTTITQDMLAHLSKCPYVGIELCDIEAHEPLTFDAESIDVSLDALPFIYDAPNCKEFYIDANGPLSDVSKYLRREFHKGMFAKVEKVRVRGYIYITDFNQLSAFIREIFPLQTIFHFNVRLVNL